MANGTTGLPRTGPRILIYSHDTMGLGHLRRCRTIAHALVEQNKDLSVLIISGSPIIGSFDFKTRVDFVRVPGVIKLRNGEYTSLNLHLDIRETLAIRASIIRHTAAAFAPDMFLVDKEPLGLRDVMDDPALLEPEWKRKNVLPALRDLYDAIWIYGLPQICDPLTGITLPKSIKRKISYTGYLQRSVPTSLKVDPLEGFGGAPYVLVTPGGGGDGEALIDWVLRAYESDAQLPHNALIVFGPFMQPELQTEFMQRIERLKRVRALTFDTRLEALMFNAAGVVAMGGYNTFCEILSFDKRAILVPRTAPRLEQFIRAQQAQEVGLVRMLGDDGERDVRAMISALRDLPFQSAPSEIVVPGLLDGLSNVGRLTTRWLSEKPRVLSRPRLAFARE